MKKKEKKKKSTLSVQPTEEMKVSKHEDVALKVTAQFFRDDILPVLAIEGKVVEILGTESIHLDLKKGYEDFNFLMEDGTIKHFEFQSTNKGREDLKRFRMYESLLSYQHKKDVVTYVLFSGSIKNPMTELTSGINTYRIQPIIMQDKNADKVIEELKKKVNAGEPLTKADLLPLVLSPLMGGKMSQRERVTAAYDITKKAAGVDEEVIRKVEAVIYTMADKYLDAEEMKQLKGEIRMTRIGQMLYDDGKEEGIELTKKVYKSHNEGKSNEVIAQECNIPVSQVEKILEI